MHPVPAIPKENKTSSLKYWLTNSGKSRDCFLILLIVFCCLYFRRPDAFYNAQFYNEDGTKLFAGYELNGIKSIFIIDQYFLLIPRLIAAVFGVLSISFYHIPLCYTMSSLFISFLVAVQLWETANQINLKNKILFATCFLFVPVGPDAFMNIINSSYILYIYLINFLFAGYKYGNKYLNLITVFFISFSGPFGLIIAPLVALMLFIDRKKLTWYTAMIYLILLVSGGIAFFTTMHADIRHRSRVLVNPLFALPPERFHLLKVFTKNINATFLLNATVFSRLPHIIFLLITVALALFSMFYGLQLY